jgi:regulator of protease activity HflC (stomatin/prohibitin superfamily)
MKDGIEYDDQEIQKAINEKFSSEQLLVTQQNNNKVIISKAEAEAEAVLIAAEAEAKANELVSASLTDKLIEKMKYEQWNGQLPTVTGNGATIVDITE